MRFALDVFFFGTAIAADILNADCLVQRCLASKHLIEVSRAVSSGSDDARTTIQSPMPDQPSPRLPGEAITPQLFHPAGHIRDGSVKSLELILRVGNKAVYTDGRLVTVPVFANDQQILRN